MTAVDVFCRYSTGFRANAGEAASQCAELLRIHLDGVCSQEVHMLCLSQQKQCSSTHMSSLSDTIRHVLVCPFHCPR